MTGLRAIAVLDCLDCEATVIRRSPTQRYCEQCSTARNRARKRNWSAANPQRRVGTPDRSLAATLNEAGKKHSEAVGMADVFRPPELLWAVRFWVPFTYAASKNHIYTSRGDGHVALRKEARAVRTEITLRTREALVGRRLAHNRFWLAVHVEKPNHKGDAVNVVDLVCDGIKDAMPFDDRLFSISHLDWSINKSDPRLYLQIGQDSDQDVKACSSCGRLLPLDAFHANRGAPLGRGRNCKDCRATATSLAAERRQKG